jgi:hypothetical protein
MIHRYIYDILTSGVTTILANPDILDVLFEENFELVSDESDAIKKYFTDNGCNIYNGYPRKTTEFPSVNILLGEENEIEHFIGDSAGLIEDENNSDYRAELYSSIWDHAYRLLIMTEHPDVTAYYYEIIKFIMLEGLNTLVDDGCFEFGFSGNELAPDPRYLPDHLFARQIVFRCQREFMRIDKASKLFRIGTTPDKVSGIHVDSSGSPSDVGNVKTNVTTYTE